MINANRIAAASVVFGMALSAGSLEAAVTCVNENWDIAETTATATP